MIDTRLILLEGLAGTGKSTLGQILCDMIIQSGLQAEFIHEFDKRNPVQVGDCPDIDMWRETVIDKWRQFVQQMHDDNQTITVLDAAFLQCPVSECLEQGVESESIFSLKDEIRDIISKLRPVVVYLHQNNIESAMRDTYESRSAKWQTKVATFLVDTPFARQNPQTGFELYLELNRQIRWICDKIIAELPFRIIRTDATSPVWPEIHRQLAAKLDIRQPKG